MFSIIFKALWAAFIPTLLIVIVAVIIGTIVSYISKTGWWEHHVGAEFPHPDECFNCDKLECPMDCPVLLPDTNMIT